jgi:hypothetical protein
VATRKAGVSYFKLSFFTQGNTGVLQDCSFRFQYPRSSPSIFTDHQLAFQLPAFLILLHHNKSLFGRVLGKAGLSFRDLVLPASHRFRDSLTEVDSNFHAVLSCKPKLLLLYPVLFSYQMLSRLVLMAVTDTIAASFCFSKCNLAGVLRPKI